MNIVFYLILWVLAIFLWFILAFIFKPIGRFFIRLWEDAKKEMKTKREKKKEI